MQWHITCETASSACYGALSDVISFCNSEAFLGMAEHAPLNAPYTSRVETKWQDKQTLSYTPSFNLFLKVLSVWLTIIFTLKETHIIAQQGPAAFWKVGLILPNEVCVCVCVSCALGIVDYC